MNKWIALVLVSLAWLSGCGLESAGTAATVGKLQADQAKQAKEQMDALKANLDAATKASEEKVRKAEEASGS